VLLEHLQLRELLGLAVASYNLALPVRRVSSGSARGGLGRLAPVTEEARGAGEVGDDGQEAHATAAARASFDIELPPNQRSDGATKANGVMSCLSRHYYGDQAGDDRNGFSIGSWVREPPRATAQLAEPDEPEVCGAARQTCARCVVSYSSLNGTAH